jgi:hypothetical protein
MYYVDEYDPDGEGSPYDARHHSAHHTLSDARAKVRKLLGVKVLSASRRWHGWR